MLISVIGPVISTLAAPTLSLPSQSARPKGMSVSSIDAHSTKLKRAFNSFFILYSSFSVVYHKKNTVSNSQIIKPSAKGGHLSNSFICFASPLFLSVFIASGDTLQKTKIFFFLSQLYSSLFSHFPGTRRYANTYSLILMSHFPLYDMRYAEKAAASEDAILQGCCYISKTLIRSCRLTCSTNTIFEASS